MNKRGMLLALGLVACGTASAGSTAMIGVSYDFDGGWGITAKLLTTNKQDRPAAAVGVTFMPVTRSFGADVDLAYVMEDSAVTAGWDFLHSQYQVGLGWANTKNK